MNKQVPDFEDQRGILLILHSIVFWVALIATVDLIWLSPEKAVVEYLFAGGVFVIAKRVKNVWKNREEQKKYDLDCR